MPTRKKSINDLIDQRRRLSALTTQLGKRRYPLESRAQDAIQDRIDNIRSSKSYQNAKAEAQDLIPLGELGKSRRWEIGNRALNRKYSSKVGVAG